MQKSYQTNAREYHKSSKKSSEWGGYIKNIMIFLLDRPRQKRYLAAMDKTSFWRLTMATDKQKKYAQDLKDACYDKLLLAIQCLYKSAGPDRKHLAEAAEQKIMDMITSPAGAIKIYNIVGDVRTDDLEAALADPAWDGRVSANAMLRSNPKVACRDLINATR